MATRRPLVIVSGRTQELPAADALTFLDATVTGRLTIASSNLYSLFINSSHANGVETIYQNSGTSIGFIGASKQQNSANSVSDFSANATNAFEIFAGGGVRAARFTSSAVTLDKAATLSSTLTVTGATRLASAGNSFGGAGQTNIGMYLREDSTVPSSSGSAWGVRSLIFSDASATAQYAFEGAVYVANGATLATAIAYRASGIAFSGTGSLAGGAYMGFSSANTNATGAGGTIYAYHTNMSASGGGTKFAFYHTGTAPNIFNGKTRIGDTTTPTESLEVAGNILTTGSVTTAAPSGSSALPWKLGAKTSATVALVTTDYLAVEVNGVACKVGLVA